MDRKEAAATMMKKLKEASKASKTVTIRQANDLVKYLETVPEEGVQALITINQH